MFDPVPQGPCKKCGYEDELDARGLCASCTFDPKAKTVVIDATKKPTNEA